MTFNQRTGDTRITLPYIDAAFFVTTTYCSSLQLTYLLTAEYFFFPLVEYVHISEN